MQRSVDHELPALSHSEAQCDAQLLALARRRDEARKSAASAAAAYRQECAALGIVGHDLMREVHALADSLPLRLAPFRDAVRAEDVSSAMRFYAEFAACAHAGDPTAELLPTLAAVSYM